MKEATIAAEYLIVGFLCFINILVVLLIFLGDKTVEIPPIILENRELLIFILLAIFYFLGALTNKSSIIQNSSFLPKLIKLIPQFSYLKPLSVDDETKRQIVFKNASSYQTQMIDNEYKFNILFRCVSILLFPLSFSISYWIYLTQDNIKLSLSLWGVLLVISVLSFRAHKIQYLNYWKLIFSCYESLEIKK